MIAKSISGGKKEESGEKLAVPEGPTTGEMPKISKFFIRIMQTNFSLCKLRFVCIIKILKNIYT